MILTPLQKMQNNIGDLGKIIVATGFKWLPKVQKIAQSGHTAQHSTFHCGMLRPRRASVNEPLETRTLGASSYVLCPYYILIYIPRIELNRVCSVKLTAYRNVKNSTGKVLQH